MATTPKTPSPSPLNPKSPSNERSIFPTPPLDSFPVRSVRINGRSSPAPTKIREFQRAASTPPEVTRENVMRTLSRSDPLELSSAVSLEQSWRRQQLSKKKSQYYGDAFAYRQSNNTAKDRVIRDSVVTAEVRINCRLESEQEFLLDLSFQLSEIYQRPESSVMVLVAPQIPMLLGGNSDPAYHLTITALQTEIAPAKNKRSAHLLQEFMFDTLGIKPKRGIVRFERVVEENLATNGITALQEIEEMARRSSEESGVLRTISRQRSRKGRKSTIPIFTERGKTPVPSADTPSHLKFSSGDTGDSKSTNISEPERKKVKRRKSIMAFFKK